MTDPQTDKLTDRTTDALIDTLEHGGDLAARESDHSHVMELTVQLGDRAATEGDVDVVHRLVDSPLGPLLVAATDRGLVRVAFDEVEGHESVLESLVRSYGPRVLPARSRLDIVTRQLDAYFVGDRHHFDVPLDLRRTSGFRATVLDHLREIPYGTTETYATVATASGSPKAVRAVGTACATNPLPVVVPCHRVVRSDGGLGGYLGGVEAKRALLDLEGA